MSASNSVAQTKTQQTAYNQQTGASSGSIALGAGNTGSVNITNADADVAKQAITSSADLAKTVSTAGLDTARSIVNESLDRTSGELETISSQFTGAQSQVAQTLASLQSSLIGVAGTAIASGQQIATNAAPTTPEAAAQNTIQKFLPYIGVLAAAAALVFIFKANK